MAFTPPFPWFGGKSRVAPVVWRALGSVPNYVEPFFGSGAVLLGRPDWTPDSNTIETVNDLDGYVANAWRAIAYAPQEVARFADWPSNENDLHARHTWLKAQRGLLQARLEADPDYYDAKIAGWWLWGLAQWIGGGFCGDSGAGPWVVEEDDEGVPVLVKRNAGQGVKRQRVQLGNAGQGVSRQRVHLGDAGQGVSRQRVHLGDAGHGVHRQRVHLGDAGQGEAGDGERGLLAWMQALSERLRRVRVCSGDWSRICGPSVTFKHGLTGVFLDPPYSAEAGRSELYTQEDFSVAHDVRDWCIANGDNPLLRIALCGYEGEGHDALVEEHGWHVYAWKANGGYAKLGNGNGRANSLRERIWFSPHCLPFEDVQPLTLFDLD